MTIVIRAPSDTFAALTLPPYKPKAAKACQHNTVSAIAKLLVTVFVEFSTR